MSTITKLAALGLAAAAAAVALPAQAEAQALPPLTFKELDKGSTFRYVDNAPRSRIRNGAPARTSDGDMLVFSNPLQDAAGASIGRLRVTCFVTSSGPFSKLQADCLGSYAFTTGTVWGAASISFASQAPVVGAVLGGTRAYAGANGTFTSTESGRDSDTTITFLP
jgi:hypothetical protein